MEFQFQKKIRRKLRFFVAFLQKKCIIKYENVFQIGGIYVRHKTEECNLRYDDEGKKGIHNKRNISKT